MPLSPYPLPIPSAFAKTLRRDRSSWGEGDIPLVKGWADGKVRPTRPAQREKVCATRELSLAVDRRRSTLDPWSGFEFFGFEEALQLADAGGVAHFAEGLGFDLADALAGDLELFADFFERA